MFVSWTLSSTTPDSPGMKQPNVVFAFTVLLHAMNPPVSHQQSGSAMLVQQHSGVGGPGGNSGPGGTATSNKSASMEWSGIRASSFSTRGPESVADQHQRPTPRDSIYEIVFLGNLLKQMFIHECEHLIKCSCVASTTNL